jgi:hypothetical protein
MRLTTCLAGALVLLSVAPVVRAQDGPGPAKVLRIVREEIKPARGAAHAKAEEAYVRAGVASKLPAYWIGMSAITGPSEAWFISSYPSYDALEKENDAFGAAVGRMMDAADEGDAPFRTGTRVYLAELDEALSYRMRANVKDMRYMTVVTTRVKPGYARAFLETRKALNAAHEKANVDEHWAFYEVTTGAPVGTYIMLFGGSAMKEQDVDPHTQAYRDAVGDEQRAKNETLMREGIAFTDVVSFEISPRMSHVPAEWIASRPDFWKAPATKTTMAAPKAPAVQPASQTRP